MQEHNEVFYCIRDRRHWGHEFTRKCLHITFFKSKKYNEASFCEFVLLILDNLVIYILVYSCKTFTYFNKAWYIRKLISFFLISGHEATHMRLWITILNGLQIHKLQFLTRKSLICIIKSFHFNSFRFLRNAFKHSDAHMLNEGLSFCRILKQNFIPLMTVNNCRIRNFLDLTWTLYLLILLYHFHKCWRIKGQQCLLTLFRSLRTIMLMFFSVTKVEFHK